MRRKEPADPELQEIENWRIQRLADHTEYLRTFPDAHLVEAQRTQFAAVIDARAAELRADYLARTR